MDCRLDPNPSPNEDKDINDFGFEGLGLRPLQPLPKTRTTTTKLSSNCWKYLEVATGMETQCKKINETPAIAPRLSLNRKIKVVRSRSPCCAPTSFVTFTCLTFVITMFLSFVTTTQVMAVATSHNNNNGPRQTTTNGIFIQLPYSSPPTVRPPPYSESSEKCPAINLRENWIDTICGDLNKGYIPANPLGHKFPDGSSYPFEILKNKTLAFFRHALPVLKTDKSLPKVARFNPYDDYQFSPTPTKSYRMKRSPRSSQENVTRYASPWADQESMPSAISELKVEGRATQSSRNRFCENPALGGLLCKMYNTMWGRIPHLYNHNHNQPYNPHHQRFDNSIEMNHHNHKQRQYPHHQPQRNYNHHQQQQQQPQQLQYEALHQAEPSIVSAESSMPATPCPSSAEYLTPVFARNHEGAWRYVVQIPREGYFTQTVEVTKCAEVNCYYMDGTCRTSPRWQSLLVAELYYPDKAFPLTSPTGTDVEQQHQTDVQKYQRYIQKRKARGGNDAVVDADNAASATTTGNDLSSSAEQIPPQCDGLDEIGCFQVRLFYDWFLIPGSCKCWRRQFDFTRGHQTHS